MKLINVLGATGSIGDSTLEVVRQHPNLFKIQVLTAGSNIEKLVNLVKEFSPTTVAIAETSSYVKFKELLGKHSPNIKILHGTEGLIEAASEPSDITVSAIVGFAGLKPTFASIANTKILAIANKESLVCAGLLIMNEVEKHNTLLIPIDSEHNALFQVYEPQNVKQIAQITITASGGPFRNLSLDEMEHVTPSMALKHPNWNMGAKITVDCATLANKGLEFIEACVLFPIEPKDVKVLVHPQSIIHGMIHYSDGSTLAHLANPDLKTHLANALNYPKRLSISHKLLDLASIGDLTFFEPDLKRFPMLKLAKDCLLEGQDALLAYNTSNELAVNAFLQNKIGFNDIYRKVNKCVEQRTRVKLENLFNIYEYNELITQQTLKLLF